MIDVLMEGVALVAVLAITSITGLQMATAVSSVSSSLDEARIEAVRRDLEQLDARQTLHYADELSYSTSLEALRFESSPGVSIAVRASGAGWAAVARHDAMGPEEGCAIYFGRALKPTGPVTPKAPGKVACTG